MKIENQGNTLVQAAEGHQNLVNALKSVASTVSEVKSNMNGGGSSGNESTWKSIMEHRVISNIEEMTNDSTGFQMWKLRLKNALNQVDGQYNFVFSIIDKDTENIMSYHQWSQSKQEELKVKMGNYPGQYDKLMQDLYVLLVDKCTDGQVTSFENDGGDGFFAYFTLSKMHAQAAGIGSIGRRDYLMHPSEAKKDNEIYDKIMAWERELKEQEKTIPEHQRPLLADVVKVTIMKYIACGQVKEYIRMHEAIMRYSELRSKVLQMTLSQWTSAK